MTVPQSLLVVALAVAWLVVLVPSSSRRRGHVKETVEGSGFRVLSRSASPSRRLVRRTAGPSTTASSTATRDRHSAFDHQGSPTDPGTPDQHSTVRSEDQMSSQQVDDSSRAGDDTHSVNARDNSPRSTGSTRYEPAGPAEADPAHDPGAQYSPEAHDDASDETAREEAAAYDEHDEAELRRQYQAWRTATRDDTAEHDSADDDTAPVGTAAEVDPADVRPIPRRPGRGLYDPEAAERARAYKFARRRRAVLVLTLLIVGFAIAAVLVSGTLWIGAGLAAVLLALFLTYLRRQVRIEADIRARRLAKLERARQIRPEHAAQAAGSAGPYAQRAPRPSQASGPVRQRSNRVVLDLDDDDPSFDDLEQYEPMEYRRAVGQ